MKKGQNFNHPVRGRVIKAEPIRDGKDILAIKRLIRENPRNLALFTLGINTPLLPGELLGIKVGQVVGLKPGDSIKLKERIRGKVKNIIMNQDCVDSIQHVIKEGNQQKGKAPDPSDLLFAGLRGPLSVPALNNLVKKWCADVALQGNYGCHTLRKTFGYQQWVRSGTDLSEIMALFNHSSQRQTKGYLCIPWQGTGSGRRERFHETTSHVREGFAQGLRGAKEKGSTIRRAEAMVRESAEKYRAIFENANDLIAYTGIDGRFIEVNNKLEDIFGYRRADFIGRHFSELNVLSTNDLEKATRALEDTIQGNPPDIIEFEAFRKDRTTAYVEVNPRFIKEDGEIKGSILIIRDITERKRAEEALRRVYDELERKVRERTVNLEEANTALKVLLKKRDEDKEELEEKMLFNVKNLVMPYLEKIKSSRLDDRQKTLVAIMESNLNDILSPFVRGMSTKHLNLTPSELQVADLVKNGKTTKEIAGLLHLSEKTIEFHRDNIRKKIGIKDKKINLRTYLLSAQ